MSGEESELYFAYASLMLPDRMACCAKEAQMVDIGKVQGYRLGFALESPNWHGGTAVAIPAPGQDMWGVIWRISNQDKKAMFRQENVGSGIYTDKEITVTSPNNQSYRCFFITMVTPPSFETLPSPQYKAVIVNGAKECKLDSNYIQKLKAIEDNGYEGQIDFRKVATHF